jgi:hypothetical protein
MICRLENRGDLDPADLLSSIITNPQEPKELRIQAAGLLMPYKYGKHGSIPPARYIEHPINIPQFSTIQEAERILAEIPLRVDNQELDFQAALDLSAMIKTWIEAKTASEFEERLTIVEQANGISHRTPAVVGGMPRIPGTDIIMPEDEP